MGITPFYLTGVVESIISSQQGALEVLLCGQRQEDLTFGAYFAHYLPCCQEITRMTPMDHSELQFPDFLKKYILFTFITGKHHFWVIVSAAGSVGY